MRYPIEKIEGIGPAYGKKLRAIGIGSTATLLKKGETPAGRKAVAAESGIDPDHILKWVNMCDLMRIRGVGEEYSELLEAAGVDTVKELRNRNPDNLAKAIAEANEKKKLVRQLPSAKHCQKWVAHAKTLVPMLSY